MKIVNFMFIFLLFCCLSATAQIKPCEELKREIDAKLQEKGVENYTLEIVPADEVEGKNVIGSCNSGKDKIVYKRDKEK